jgi:hypothetical protein
MRSGGFVLDEPESRISVSWDVGFVGGLPFLFRCNSAEKDPPAPTTSVPLKLF